MKGVEGRMYFVKIGTWDLARRKKKFFFEFLRI